MGMYNAAPGCNVCRHILTPASTRGLMLVSLLTDSVNSCAAATPGNTSGTAFSMESSSIRRCSHCPANNTLKHAA
eukprot:7539854-Pyramimonas_sp.AAC.1